MYIYIFTTYDIYIYTTFLDCFYKETSSRRIMKPLFLIQKGVVLPFTFHTPVERIWMELVSVFCMSGRDRTGKFYHCYLALQEVVGCWNWAESCQGPRSTKHHLVSFSPFLKRVLWCLGIASIKVSLKFSKNGSCASWRLKFKWTWPGLAHCVGGKNCLSNKMFPEERFYG